MSVGIGCGGLYRQHLPREIVHLNTAAGSEHIQLELALKPIWQAWGGEEGLGHCGHQMTCFMCCSGEEDLNIKTAMRIMFIGESFSAWLYLK